MLETLATYWEALLVLGEKYPALATVIVTTIVWPAITSVGSFLFAPKEETRFPLLAAIVRKTGLDLAGFLRFIRANWPKRLPPPPSMVLMLCFVLGGLAVGVVACGPAQHPCVTAYEKARTEAEIAEVDKTCGHMLLGGGGQGGGQ